MAKKGTRKKTAKTSKTAARKKAKKPRAKKKTVKKPASKKKSAKKVVKKKPSKKATPRKPSRARAASMLGIQTQHVDFLTYKIDQVRKFYTDVLELKAETRDADGLNYLIVATSSSSSLGFMPPHPEMRGEQPLPREPTLYFLVKDLDRAYALLIAKGVGFMGPPQEMPWGHRVVTTTDPEGRTIMLAEKVPRR